jgi:hypothetical protein
MKLTRLELSRLHVACADALGVGQGHAEGRAPRQRAAFAELVGTCPLLLADALEASLALDDQLDPQTAPHRFSGRELARTYGSQDLASYAAKLIGARWEALHWTTAEPGCGATLVKLPPDFWHEYLITKAEMARPKKEKTE